MGHANIQNAMLCLPLVTVSGMALWTLVSAGWNVCYYAVIAYAIMFMSALTGVARYVMIVPTPGILSIHRTFTFLSTTLGLSFIAAELFFKSQPLKELGYFHVVIGCLMMFIKLFSDYQTSTLIGDYAAIVTLTSILLFSIQHGDVNAGVGALVLLGTGFLIGSKRTLFRFPFVDFFNCSFALAIYFLYRALLKNVMVYLKCH